LGGKSLEMPYYLPVPTTERAYCTFLRGYAETPYLQRGLIEDGVADRRRIGKRHCPIGEVEPAGYHEVHQDGAGQAIT